MSAGGAPAVELVGDRDPVSVSTEVIGFKGLAGDKKIRLLPAPYALDALPTPSSTLFAIANKRGLYAAAGPSSFVIGTTASLRAAFEAESDEYTPSVAVQSFTKITHIAFNADESYLLFAGAQNISAYKLDGLAGGGEPKAEFEVALPMGVRELKPNPMIAGLCAVVTDDGQVRVLDLDTRDFVAGADGQILKTGCSTVCWSKLGKQIMCGMLDGTGWQMTPQGEGKATLPAPPELEGSYYMASVLWVENHLFLTTHTPVPNADEPNNESVFHVLTRAGGKHTYRRIAEPTPPFGMEARAPPYMFSVQLRQYPPHLKDLVLYSSTCSSDVGIVARFETEVGEAPKDEFVSAVPLDDTRRVQLPLCEPDFSDSSTIGIAVDLSNKENVKRPVGGEEIDESPGPLPILMILTHEGFLCAWHVIYNQAIEKSEKYPGMMIYQDQPASQQTVPQTPPPAPKPAAAAAAPFASPRPTGFGTTPTPFGGQPAAQPAFGQSAFGTPAAKPAFGQSAFGQSSFGQPSTPATSSPWGSKPPTTPATTAPAFGTATATSTPAPPQPAFGSSSTLGSTSAFGKPAALGGGATAFGQPSPLGGNAAFGKPSSLGGNAAFGKPSAFGTPATPTASPGTFGAGSGFGAYASKGGFAAAAASAPQGASPFGSGKPLGSSQTPSAFGGGPAPAQPSFGQPTSGFNLGSGFKADASQGDGKPDNSNGSAFGGLGSGFGAALEGAPVVRPGPSVATNTAFGMPSGSPFSTPSKAPSAFGNQASVASPFGTPVKPNSNPFGAVKAATPFGAPAAATPNPFGAAASPFGQATSKPAASPFAQLPSNASPFASPLERKTSAGNPFASAASPFGTPSKPPASSPFAQLSSDKAERDSSDEEDSDVEVDAEPAPLPPSPKFTPPAKDEVDEAAPLPPDSVSRASYEPGSTTSGSGKDMPSSPDNSPPASPGGDAPLPPDFASFQPKTSSPPPALPSDSEGEQDEDEADEEDDEDYDQADDEGDSATANKGSLFTDFVKKTEVTPSPSADKKSSVFDGGTSYNSMFGSGAKPTGTTPFSSLAVDKDEIVSESDGDDDDNESEEEAPAAKPKSRLSGGLAGRMGKGSAKKDEPKKPSFGGKTSANVGGGLFGKKDAPKTTTKSDEPRTAGHLGFNSPAAPGGLFGSPKPEETKDPRPSMFGAKTTPAPGPGGLFGQPAPAVKSSLFAPQPTERPSSAPPAPAAFARAAATPPVRQADLKPEPPTPEPEPVIVREPVDFSRVYPDHCDEEIRTQIHEGPLVPTAALAPIKPLAELEVPDDFNDVFDSIYQSGNMMLNKLGQVSKDLRAYHTAQAVKLEGAEHSIPTDTEEEWRLCEMGIISVTVAEMTAQVNALKTPLPALQTDLAHAEKSYIKLGTKLTETRHLLSPHLTPSAASTTRTRILAPEQQLLQRTLRKSFTLTEKKLKETEHLATMLKSRIAARDRGRSDAAVKPPTAEAVRSTVLKLTGMVERKGREVEYLEEKVRRLRGRSASVVGSGMSSGGGTPRGTPMRETPTRGTPGRGGMTPVLRMVEEAEVEGVREGGKERRERGRRVRELLEVRGGRKV